MKKNAIAVLSKVPLAGFSKTRLAPPFTLKQCALLGLVFLKDTLKTLAKLESADVYVYCAPETKRKFMAQLLEKTKIRSEEGRSLGQKAVFIFNALFREGYHNVLVIPADCPDMPEEYLKRAFKAVSKDRNAVVIGPSSDGALYMIGANACQQGAVDRYLINIDWDEEFSLEALADRFKRGKISVHLLPEWHDIDSFSDIISFLKRSGRKKTYTRALLNTFPYPNFSRTIIPLRVQSSFKPKSPAF